MKEDVNIAMANIFDRTCETLVPHEDSAFLSFSR